MDRKIKEDIIQTIKNLRILSMNIVNHHLRIKESTSHHIMSGKFDYEAISRLIPFEKNYLLKMKNDTDFLYNSSIKKYFDFAPESDPFLIAISGPEDNKEIVKDKDTKALTTEHNAENKPADNGNNNMQEINDQNKPVNYNTGDNATPNEYLEDKIYKNNENNNYKSKKITVEIPKEISEIIKSCQFSILQELIYNEIGINAFNKNDITSTTGKSSISIKSTKTIRSKPIINNKNILGEKSQLYPISTSNANNNDSKSKSNSKNIKKTGLRPIESYNTANSNNSNLNNIVLNNPAYVSNSNNNNTYAGIAPKIQYSNYNTNSNNNININNNNNYNINTNDFLINSKTPDAKYLASNNYQSLNQMFAVGNTNNNNSNNNYASFQNISAINNNNNPITNAKKLLNFNAYSVNSKSIFNNFFFYK